MSRDTIASCFPGKSDSFLGENTPEVFGSDDDGQGVSTSENKQPFVEFVWEQADKEWTADIKKILALQEVRKAYPKQLTYKRALMETHLTNRRTLEFNEIVDWEFEHFRNHLTGKNPSFGYKRTKILPRVETAQIIVDWLHTQFNHQWAHKFLEFVSVFNRDFGKLNAICLVGPAGCGKTWFIKMWCAIAKFVGKPINYDGKTAFTYDNCLDSRLLFFDEVKFPANAPQYMEAMKELMAGSEPVVQVKHKPLQPIDSTPMFLAANVDPFTDCNNQRQYFVGERMLLYHVYSMPDFKKRTQNKWGHPLALFDVWEEAKKHVGE